MDAFIQNFSFPFFSYYHKNHNQKSPFPRWKANRFADKPEKGVGILKS